jgi:hypothetical protein
VDQLVAIVQPEDRGHSIVKDELVAVNEPFREHDLDFDEVVTVDEDDSDHELSEDSLVEAPSMSVKEHGLEADSRVSTPRFSAREHSLSKDIRIATPTGRSPFSHGIHLDERAPTPEIVRLDLEHDIRQDSRSPAPGPSHEDHDLDDERAESPVLPAKQHRLWLGKRMPSPLNKLKEHDIRVDDLNALAAAGRPKDHSINIDKTVGQRAHQLLEHFLERDRKPNKTPK